MPTPRLIIITSLLISFVLCGTMGMFCPMLTTAGETPHPQPASQHSTSNHGDCPDQIKSSEEPSRYLTYDVVAYSKISELAAIYKSALSQYFYPNSFSFSSSYPLLFLLFGVFLN